MKVVAVGPTETLVGLMLGGVKERLETDEPNEVLKYLNELVEKEASYMIVIASEVFREIENEIADLQEKRRSFIFYELVGGDLRWRKRI